MIKKTGTLILLLTIYSAIYLIFSDLVVVTDSESTEKAKIQKMPNLTGEEAKEYLNEQGLYKSLGEAMNASHYSIYPTQNAPLPKHKEAFEANNPKQAFSTYFAKDGIHLVSKAKNNKWRVQMNLKGYAYGDNFTEVKETRAKVQKKKSRIELTKSAVSNSQTEIVEWYENRKDGLEQGWTINEKLANSNKELKLVFEFGGDLKPMLAKDKEAIDFVRDKNKQILKYDKLKSWDATGQELVSKMDLNDKKLSIIVDDRNAKYPITIDPTFTQTKKLTASDAAAEDNFGDAVGISGDTAIVGADRDDDGALGSGSAYIFQRNTGGDNNWGEVTKLNAADPDFSDEFGDSVAISGDTVIVGSPFDDDNGSSTGSAYIFERNQGGANNWGQVKKLNASDAFGGDSFGWSVGISGDTAIVGTPFNDETGSAYIFDRNNGGANNWGEVKILTASDAADRDNYGISVGISGDTAVVGAAFNDDAGNGSGSAYIYERSNGGADNWGEVKKLTASNASSGDQFGISVGISGGTAIIGAERADNPSNSGSAYIFERNTGGANNWGEVKILTASDAASFDNFGSGVGISGDSVVVGADGNDDPNNSGSAYIFERNTGGANNWGEVNKFTASDAAADDFFGESVGISGTTAIAGAKFNDDVPDNSGSAYIFDANTQNMARADFDGDGRTDISVFRPNEGNWYLQQSTDGFGVINFGIASDTLVPGDYDGDGKADTAVFRPDDNEANTDFFILNSNGFTISGFSWGITGDIPVVGDYDGDGKDDVAVWRESDTTWYIVNSSDGTDTIEQYGLAGDMPLVMDSDGDGKVNLTIYRPSENTWYIARATGTPATNFDSIPFGETNDLLVPGDYDGDGKDDIAVFRPNEGNWFILNSGTGSTSITQFGANGDIPIPGDYDGDGTEDPSVYRNGDWWVNGSTSGISVNTFGINSDIPIPSRATP